MHPGKGLQSTIRSHARGRVKAVEIGKRGTQLNIHVVGSERPAVINDLVVLYM